MKTNKFIYSVTATTLVLIVAFFVFKNFKPKVHSQKQTNTVVAVLESIKVQEKQISTSLPIPHSNSPAVTAKAIHPSELKTITKTTPSGTKNYPNIKYKALYVPNDTQQWYTDSIQAPQTWSKTTGTDNTTVAVIDTGFALKHDEFFDRWSTNSGEMGGGKETNGVDDDSNGYIDDWRGWDFFQSDNNPNAGSVNANGLAVSHGTSVAGLVGATGNNSLGVASINWKTKILPLQALSDDGDGYTSTVAEAMHYAVDRGVDVISLSLGADIPDELILEEINYASAHNVLVVAAAGNDGCNCLLYPANYEDVLSVGATDQNNLVASFSSYGPDLDVVAPGSGSIISPIFTSTNAQNVYSSSLYGTSFSAPIVSGLAALLKGEQPDATPASIAIWIKSNADPLAGGKSGSGKINAYNSLLSAKPTVQNTTPTKYMPLFRLYKNNQTILYTTSIDRQRSSIIQQSNSYEILKYIQY